MSQWRSVRAVLADMGPTPLTAVLRRPSLSRRAAAGFLDVPPLVVLGLGLWGRTRSRSELGRRLVAMAVRGVYVSVPTAIFGGTAGQLLVGLRVVDADSYRMVGWKQAAIRCAIEGLPGLLLSVGLRRSIRKLNGGTAQRLERIEAHLQELEEEGADDPEGLDAQRLAMYQAAVGSEAQRCFLVVGATSAAYLACFFTVISRLRDRFSNTVVVTSDLVILSDNTALSQGDR